MLKAYYIVITGLVQGIGFRPHVARLAEEHGLCGTVKNAGGNVIIEVEGEEQAMDEFIHRLSFVGGENSKDFPAGDNSLKVNPPESNPSKDYLPGAIIQSMDAKEQPLQGFEKFEIVYSEKESNQLRFFPADLPVCKKCEAELRNPSNRRYRYPFISCVSCGPRFSIQKDTPYDRDTITMDCFPMCDKCKAEYTEQKNRRRHAQTIGCFECGPKLQLILPENISKTIEKEATLNCEKKSSDENFAGTQQQILTTAVFCLKVGKIGAIKDTGGFHFAFSPFSSEAATRLREFKNREAKPFAVMFPNIESIREYCVIGKKEEELLLSDARPIVLLEKKEYKTSSPAGKHHRKFVFEICGNMDRIGAFLPCNPLQILLLEETGPLVMTSGNRGGEPILTENEPMEQYMKQSNCPDFILTHDRKIVEPLDDSIYQVTKTGEREIVQVVRRARGLVPNPIFLENKLPQDTSAAGGDLKSVFALGKENVIYLSQHFGDVEDMKAQEAYEKSYLHMKEMFQVKPECICMDMHPGYISRKLILEPEQTQQDFQQQIKFQQQENQNQRENQHQQREQESQLKIREVQHHHAHVAAVMAEHRLKGPVLGVAFDGTGYGIDGTIWGSEFLLCKGQEFKRVGHLEAVPLLSGQENMKNAKHILSGYCVAAELRQEKALEIMEKDATYQMISAAIHQQINTTPNSSMGRLFDAASALLGICDYNSYEGQCAIELEIAAAHGKQENVLTLPITEKDGILIGDSISLLAQLAEKKGDCGIQDLARGFHEAIIDYVVDNCQRIGNSEDFSIALCGGTFLNRILLEGVTRKLEEKGYQVYTCNQVSPGDGSIALGQIALESF